MKTVKILSYGLLVGLMLGSAVPVVQAKRMPSGKMETAKVEERPSKAKEIAIFTLFVSVAVGLGVLQAWAERRQRIVVYW